MTLRGDVTGPEPLGDTVDFTATNSQTARAHIDQGISLFGDYETPNADGVLRIIVGVNAVTSTQWQSLNYTGSAIEFKPLRRTRNFSRSSEADTGTAWAGLRIVNLYVAGD